MDTLQLIFSTKTVRALLIVAASVIGLLFVTLLLTVTHPAAGEIAQNTMLQIGLVINITFVVIIALGFVSAFAVTAKDYVAQEYNKAGSTQALLGPVKTGLHLGKDVLVYRHAGETDEAFAGRVSAATSEANAGRWVVVIDYQDATGMIYQTPTKAAPFERKRPPFLKHEESDTVSEGYYFSAETAEQYAEYLDYFCREFREFSGSAKLLNEQNPAQVHGKILAASAMSVLLFLSVPSFGQETKSQAVMEQLGAKASEKPDGEVSYIFEKGTLTRSGRGDKSYIDLLKSVPSYNDRSAGRLVAVTLDNRLVTVTQAPQQPADRMRPHTSVATVPDEQPNGGFEMPDSIQMQQSAERAKYEIWRAQQALSTAAKPWWGVVMYALWIVFPILLVLMLVLWFAAGVFSSEGMYEWHKRARSSFAILSVAVVSVLLVNIMVTAIYAGFSPLVLTGIAILEARIAYGLTTRLIPNFSPDAGNAPMRQTSNHRQLPG